MKALTKLMAMLAVTALASGAMATTNPTLDAKLAQFARFGFTSPRDMQNYFTVSDVKIDETASKLSAELAAQFQAPAAPAPAGTDPISVISSLAGVDLTQWITLGQQLWQVVVNNKPVANVATQRLSVLPMAQPNWAEMENWKGPAVKTFTIAAKNMYGATVISHTYTVAFNYGGQVAGHGAFLANATVIPTSVDVSWGFKLNSNVEVGTVLNTGTKLDPAPGVDLQLKWAMDSILSHLEGTESFFVKGDGTAMHVTAAH